MLSPYHLQPLIPHFRPEPDLLQFDTQHSPASHSPSPSQSPARNSNNNNEHREIRCVEGYGYNLYVGASDGTVEWWVCEGSAYPQTNGWVMRHKHTLFPRRPVSKMYILPKVSKLFVISDGTMHALTLPSLEAVPSTIIPTMRGVVSVILNDDELDYGPGSEEKTDMTIVIVRRRVLGIYRLGNRLQSIKEIPLPSSPTAHALFQTYLCCALLSPETSQIVNCVVDLSDASLTEVLPVSQVPPLEGEGGEGKEAVNANIVVIPDEKEFLVTSYTGTSTMGVFLNGQGDPVRGTIAWTSHPLSITVESNWIIALLSDQTISIHSLSDLDRPVQVIPLPHGTNAMSLSYSPYGVRVSDVFSGEKLKPSKMRFLSGKVAPTIETPATVEEQSKRQGEEQGDSIKDEEDDPPAGSGLTSPSSPKPALEHTADKSPAFITAMSETFLVTASSILSLIPTPDIMLLESLCEEHQMSEAASLISDIRRHYRKGTVEPSPSPIDTLNTSHLIRYLSLVLASQLTLSASFEKAAEYWVKGKVDPRWVVRLFEGLRGKMIGSEEEGEIFSGLASAFMDMELVDALITSSIKRNYSPHLTPSTSLSPASTDLRQALENEANKMLAEVLSKIRVNRRKGGGARGLDSRKIDMVVDTTLAKLLTLLANDSQESTEQLLSLLSSSNDIIMSEVEPFLEKRKYVLAKVKEKNGEWGRVLDILRELVESGNQDPMCKDPVQEVAMALMNVQDVDTWTDHVLWMIAKRPEKALDVIINHPPATLSPANFLPRLQPYPETHQAYLEHIVVKQRSPSRDLHQQLLCSLLDEIQRIIVDDGVKYHLDELQEEYKKETERIAGIKGKERETFIYFFARLAPDTPIKRLRLKLAFFLHGSPFYDITQAEQRLEGMERLVYEKAIVYGKLGKHRPALQLLALTLFDPLSAQTYATSAGEILPPRLARSTSSISGIGALEAWATLGEVGKRKKVKDDGGKLEEALVQDLLDVYMQDGTPLSLHCASTLLNTLPHLLPLYPILGSMPPSWPLNIVSPFFVHSIRRGTHKRWEGMVKKGVARGEFAKIEERWLEEMREIAPVVKEVDPDSGAGDSIWDEKIDEKEEYAAVEKDEKGQQEMLSEKMPLRGIDAGRTRHV
ncbi:hypothetical protein C360_00255 [Cryptococcus neoformans Bt15]|nr:hypothetical protein C360_00255 [Cryptococcus neoformans var. grubii Bt15]